MSIAIIVDGEETGRLEIAREGNYTLFYGHCADPGRLLRLSVYGGGEEGYIGVMMPDHGALSVKKRFSRYDLRSFPATIEYAGEAKQRRLTPKTETVPGEETDGKTPAREDEEKTEAECAASAAAEEKTADEAEEDASAAEKDASDVEKEASPPGANVAAREKDPAVPGKDAVTTKKTAPAPGTDAPAPGKPSLAFGKAAPAVPPRPACPRYEARSAHFTAAESDESSAAGEERCSDEDSAENGAPASVPEPPAPAARSPDGGTLLWYEVGDGSLYTVWQGRPYVAIPLSSHGLPEEKIVERRRIEGVDYAVFAARHWG